MLKTNYRRNSSILPGNGEKKKNYTIYFTKSIVYFDDTH